MVFCDVGGHAITHYMTCWIIKTNDIVFSMDWLKTTNLVIDWVFCSLELTVDANLHIVLDLPVNNVSNLTL